MTKRILILLAICLMAPLSWADSSAVNKLNQRLANLDSMSAKFEQWTSDPSGIRLQESTGVLEVKRPHLFRWEVQAPFPQLILADGKTVKLYDPDLAQLVIQPIDDQFNMTPALLLSGETDQLDANYQVSRTHSDNLEHFLLLPKNPDSLFEKLRLSFARGEVAEMMLIDALGSRTQIRFSEVKQNRRLSRDRFTLDLPDGVDVIDERR